MSDKVINLEEVIKYVRLAPEPAIRRIYQEAAKRLNLNLGDSDDEGPEIMTNMSDLLSNAMSDAPPSRTNSIAAGLRERVEENGALDDISPPDLEVTLKLVSKNDQYGTADFQVISDMVREKLITTKAACDKIGAHFPYGYGIEKNLLRISKCKPTSKSPINVTIRFYVWSRDGKKGITCYLKK